MTRHLLDRPKTKTSIALTRALAIERQTRPSLATLALQRRRRKRDWDQRAKFYAQFDRGVRP
jgi:hypothetical protein